MTKFQIMITLSPRTKAMEKPASDDDMSSLEDLDDTGESLEAIIGELKAQMTTLDAACGEVRGQVKSLFRRARTEEVRWMDDPLVPRQGLKEWLERRGLKEDTLTLRAFLDAVFSAATSMDLETRVLTFAKKDANALWAGQTRLTIFDVIAALPQLFQ